MTRLERLWPWDCGPEDYRKRSAVAAVAAGTIVVVSRHGVVVVAVVDSGVSEYERNKKWTDDSSDGDGV